MKRIGLAAVIAAAMIVSGCGSSEGSSGLTVINADSEGNVVSSSAVDTEPVSSAGTVTASDTQVSSAPETTTAGADSSQPENSSQPEESSSQPQDSSVPDDSSQSPDSGEYDMAAALSALNGIGGDSALKAFGPAQPSQASLDAVNEQISAMTAEGHKVSFVLLDLNTMSGFSFNSGAGMCVQSVVKSVYIGSLVESDPSVFAERYQDIHDAITYSLNDAYDSLRADYGSDCLRKWCAEAGVSQSIADTEYPVMSSADMLKLWTRLCRFFNTDETGAQLAKVFQATIGSAGRQLFIGKYTVQTKAGWECGTGDSVYYDPDAYIPDHLTDGDPFNDECAANDAGIVYTENGAYMYVIFSDIPFGVFEQNTPSNPLTGLLTAMHNAQCTMHNE